MRKYLAQHPGEKMDFALQPVPPGKGINPAFPLVKVGDSDFQLIPKECAQILSSVNLHH